MTKQNAIKLNAQIVQRVDAHRNKAAQIAERQQSATQAAQQAAALREATLRQQRMERDALVNERKMAALASEVLNLAVKCVSFFSFLFAGFKYILSVSEPRDATVYGCRSQWAVSRGRRVSRVLHIFTTV